MHKVQVGRADGQSRFVMTRRSSTEVSVLRGTAAELPDGSGANSR